MKQNNNFQTTGTQLVLMTDITVEHLRTEHNSGNTNID